MPLLFAVACAEKPLTVADVAERAGPSVVFLQLVVVAPSTAGPAECLAAGSFWTGTGFAVAAPNLVLTNNHVVTPCPAPAPTYRMVAKLADGTTTEFSIIGRDSLTDLALIRLDGATLRPLEFATSDSVRSGTETVAIGYPDGDNLGTTPTVTKGIVSASGRHAAEMVTSVFIELADLIQTDAAINHGNSGGPLLDLTGRVVGVNTLGSDKSEGLNLAVSARIAARVASDLASSSRARRASFGVTDGFAITESGALAYEGAGQPVAAGLMITALEPGSPAAGALRYCDVIEEIDGTAIRGPGDLNNRLLWLEPGRSVTVAYRRYPEGKCDETKDLVTALSESLSPPPLSTPTLLAGFSERLLNEQRADSLCRAEGVVDVELLLCQLRTARSLAEAANRTRYLEMVAERNQQILNAKRSEGTRETAQITLR